LGLAEAKRGGAATAEFLQLLGDAVGRSKAGSRGRLAWPAARQTGDDRTSLGRMSGRDVSECRQPPPVARASGGPRQRSAWWKACRLTSCDKPRRLSRRPGSCPPVGFAPDPPIVLRRTNGMDRARWSSAVRLHHRKSAARSLLRAARRRLWKSSADKRFRRAKRRV